MQTFLPYPDFPRSAGCLDNKRLGKQRVEVLQILNALRNGGGWSNHPAVKMWRGSEEALIRYGQRICSTWLGRGFRDTCYLKITSFRRSREQLIFPKWIGNESFHASHRSNLLRKDPEFYGRFGWTEPNDLPYIWPKGVEG